MKNNLPKVLMLGWEFPPIINGGLGVACHDLSSAMSEIADITMVVPKTSPGFKMKNMNLVGINNIDVNTFDSLPQNFHTPLPFKLHSVPADINPYYSQNNSEHSSQFMGGTKNTTGKEKLEAFNIDSLYGGDVIHKVMQYADITASIASTMPFDVIHAHDWMTMLAGIKIKEQTGKPLVMHIHSLEVDRSGPDNRGWVYQLEKKGMEFADLLMPVSQFTANNITKHYGIAQDKMKVVHNGSMHIQSFKSERKFREKTVLFVGRLTRQKGPEKFLDIATRVLDVNPDVRFVMAGVGDYLQNVLEKSSYRHIGNRFHMTGFLNQEKLRYLFSVSDVYCMPSVSEPFGLSAVEAAHFGIPCVISKQSGVAEVLSGALKFDFWDDKKAAGYILNLLNDDVLRRKVVSDASTNLKNITWDISARKIVDAYAEKQFI
ncbi:MAG: a-glycosyltransferase-related protein glycosyltransferase family 4 protein [Bacteroidetes bacterium]|nr:a-glycosyltransferase-related protein glycosyltransferase family 4 protein [Bacteroidota bacterium]